MMVNSTRRSSVSTGTDSHNLPGYGGEPKRHLDGLGSSTGTVRLVRGERRKSITVTRKRGERSPAIEEAAAARLPAAQPPPPMRLSRRSESSLSRASVASDFATINEGAVCEDFATGDRRDGTGNSRPAAPGTSQVTRRVSFSASPPPLPPRRRPSSASSIPDRSSPGEGRRVSVIGLQGRRGSAASSLLAELETRRLSTVSDGVVIRRSDRSVRRHSGSDTARHRRGSAEAHSLLVGRRSFPPPPAASQARFGSSGPAHRSFPPPYHQGNVVYESDDDSREPSPRAPSMAETEDLSYEATLRRASLASIHEMHHAVALFKDQKAQARIEKAMRDSSGGHDSRRSSLPSPSVGRSVDSTSSRQSSPSDGQLMRRQSVSSSIQDMHQQVALIKERRLVRHLNAKDREDGAGAGSQPRRESTDGRGRRASLGASSVGAASLGRRSDGRRSRGSDYSDSYSSSSGGDYTSSSASSSSDYSSTDSDSYSSSYYSDSDSDYSASERTTSTEYSDGESDGSGGSDRSGSDRSSSDRSGSSSDSGQTSGEDGEGEEGSDWARSTIDSTATDSGNGTLSSSHGSKSAGPEAAGPSGLGDRGDGHRQVPVKARPRPSALLGDDLGAMAPSSVKDGGRGGTKGTGVVQRGSTQSKACVIL